MAFEIAKAGQVSTGSGAALRGSPNPTNH